MTVHPITVLREQLAADFARDLPPGVSPVTGWCAEPQFFPGATGLLSAASWNDVEPGARVDEPLLPVVHRGVMVIGNYQASLRSYQRVLDGTIGGFPTTWRVLRHLLTAVAPREVFLTNAYIGLPDVDSDTATFPTTREFSQRCQRLLGMELELLDPRLVVCLGVPAARMLASIVDSLAAWRPWTSYAALDVSDARTVPSCTFAQREFVAVAVHHPSSRTSTLERERDVQLIAEAAQPA